MQVVAEWVTSADQLHRLRMLGCDMVQGYLLGEPIAADAESLSILALADQYLLFVDAAADLDGAGGQFAQHIAEA